MSRNLQDINQSVPLTAEQLDWLDSINPEYFPKAAIQPLLRMARCYLTQRETLRKVGGFTVESKESGPLVRWDGFSPPLSKDEIAAVRQIVREELDARLNRVEAVPGLPPCGTAGDLYGSFDGTTLSHEEYLAIAQPIVIEPATLIGDPPSPEYVAQRQAEYNAVAEGLTPSAPSSITPSETEPCHIYTPDYRNRGIVPPATERGSRTPMAYWPASAADTDKPARLNSQTASSPASTLAGTSPPRRCRAWSSNRSARTIRATTGFCSCQPPSTNQFHFSTLCRRILVLSPCVVDVG